MELRSGKTFLVWLFCLTLASSSVLWVTASSAKDFKSDDQGMRGRCGGPCGHMHMLKKLNLTDAQKRDVAGILKEHRDQGKSLATQMMDARKKLSAALSSPNYDEAAVRQAAQDVSKVQEDMAVLRAQIHHQIREVLSADQQSKLDAMKAKFGTRMQKRIDCGFNRLDQWIDRNSD